MNYLLSTCIFILGCARPLPSPKLDIAPEAVIYFNQFQLEYGQLVNNLSITFTHVDMEYAGYCIHGSSPAIVLNASYWQQHPDFWERRLLIFHEMGHCILQLSHTEEGIMSPILINNYNALTAPYLDAVLFGR